MTATDLAAEVTALRRRVLAALGQEPADLVLRDCRVVNTYSEEIHPADIAILDGWVVAVRERYDGTATETVDCAGRFALPGLIEPRLLPPMLADGAREAVVNGTTAVFAWGHGRPDSLADLDELVSLPWRVYGVTESGMRPAPGLTPVTLTKGLSFADGEDLLGPLRQGRALLLTDAEDTRLVADTLVDVVLRAVDTRYICLGEAEGRVYLPLLAALAAGMPAVRAVQLAGLNAATHYGRDHEIGSVAPGRRADIVLLDELDRFPAERVYVGGRLVATAGTPRW